MTDSSKAIGGIMQFTGVILCLIGAINGNLAFGGIGVLTGLLGRMVSEYWEDWFG